VKDRELLEAILQKIGGMESRMTSMESRMTSMESRMTSMESKMTSMESKMTSMESKMESMEGELVEVKVEVKFTKEAVIKMESDHGQKLGALFDGHKLNSEKLDRIENEVTKHEEIILRRIR